MHDEDRDQYTDFPSVFDCGAGDGRALEYLTEGERYAIEISQLLIQSMDSSIFIIGTAFEAQP